MATRTACQPGWETLCRCTTCIHIYMIWLFFWIFIWYNVLNRYEWWTLHCLFLMSHWFNCIPEKRVFLPSPKPIDIRRLHHQSQTPTLQRQPRMLNQNFNWHVQLVPCLEHPPGVCLFICLDLLKVLMLSFFLFTMVNHHKNIQKWQPCREFCLLFPKHRVSSSKLMASAWHTVITVEGGRCRKSGTLYTRNPNKGDRVWGVIHKLKHGTSSGPCRIVMV